MCDPGAPDLVFAGQASDVGTGAADPPALDDGSPPPRLRQMPSQQLAAKSAAEDQHFHPFWFSHELPPYWTLVLLKLTVRHLLVQRPHTLALGRCPPAGTLVR